MDTIQNIDLVKDLLTPARLEKLEQHALAFEERSKIQFSIVGFDTKVLTVSVSQGPIRPKWMVQEREMERIATSFFEFYFPDLLVVVVFGQYGTSEIKITEKQATPRLEVSEVDQRELEILPNQNSVIQNFHLLEGLLPPAKLQKMEYHASSFQRHSEIIFVVNKVDDPEIVVSAVQLAAKKFKVLGPKEISTICRSFFEFYLEGKRIVVKMLVDRHLRESRVTSEWILERIKERSITPMVVADETGLSLLKLTNWMNGHTKMPTEIKAMFYYMLR